MAIKTYLKELKEDSPCTDCGKHFHYSLMDFDHRNPDDKLLGIARAGSAFPNESRLKAEIAKCDLVCCMCHRIRTWNRSNPDNQI